MKISRYNDFINEAKTPKKYGFTYTARDYKEPFNEIRKTVINITKKYPGFEFFDAETGWNDMIYTVISNYKNIEKFIEDFQEDLFIGSEADSDKDGILWFDTPAELKALIKKGIDTYNAEINSEDKDHEDFQDILKSKKKEANDAYSNWMDKLNDMDLHSASAKERAKIAKRNGWSLSSAATYLALKELGIR